MNPDNSSQQRPPLQQRHYSQGHRQPHHSVPAQQNHRDKAVGVLTKRHTCLAHPPPRSKSLDRSLHCFRHGIPYMDAPNHGYSSEDSPRSALNATQDNAEDLRLRRTVLLERVNGSYGFTLQSYGIQYGHSDGEVEVLTYVDFVDENGVAYKAGLRTGDVILSINGTDVEKADHKDLVAFIQNSSRLRMVVLYEDCARRVDLHMRYITLTQKLQYAVSEFKQLCKKEKQLLYAAQRRHSRRRRDKSSHSPGISPRSVRKSRERERDPVSSAPSTLTHGHSLQSHGHSLSLNHAHAHGATPPAVTGPPPPYSQHQMSPGPVHSGHHRRRQGHHGPRHAHEGQFDDEQSPSDSNSYFPGRGVLKLLMKAKLEEKTNNNPSKYKALGGCWTSCDDVSDKNHTNERDSTNDAPPPPPPGYDEGSTVPAPQSTSAMSAVMAKVSGERRHHHHHHHKKRSKSQKGNHKQLVNDSDAEEVGDKAPHRPRSTENLIAQQKTQGQPQILETRSWGRRETHERRPCENWKAEVDGRKQSCSCLRSKSFSTNASYSVTKLPGNVVKATQVSVVSKTQSKRWSISMTRPKTPTSKDEDGGQEDVLLKDEETET